MAVVRGERRFAAPPARVFEALTDADVIASAIPAVRSHRVIDADHWVAKVKPPLPFAPSMTIGSRCSTGDRVSTRRSTRTVRGRM